MDLQQWAVPVQSAEGLHKNNQMCFWARPPINSYYCLLIFTDYNKMSQKARVRTVCEAFTATHNSMRNPLSVSNYSCSLLAPLATDGKTVPKSPVPKTRWIYGIYMDKMLFIQWMWKSLLPLCYAQFHRANWNPVDANTQRSYLHRSHPA